jgi:tetratricopeptide (TPR) repeat protein
MSSKGRGATSAPTTSQGRTRIRLPAGVRPGDKVSIQVVATGGQHEWVLISPWNEQVIVPSFEAGSENFVPIVLAKRSDRGMLESGDVLTSMVSRFQQTLNTISTTRGGLTEEERQTIFAEQAREQYGLEPHEVDRIIRAYERETQDAYERGVLAIYSGNYREALDQLSGLMDREGIEDSPAGLDTLYQLMVASQLYATKLLRSNPAEAEETLYKAQSYVEAALKYNAASPTLVTLLGYTHKDLTQLYRAQGKHDRARENLERAEKYFEAALELDAHNASAHNGIGNIYLLKGDYEEAIQWSTKATELEPKYLFAYHDLALLYFIKVRQIASDGAPIRQKEYKRALVGFANAYQTMLALDGDPAAGTLAPDTRYQFEQMASWVHQEVKRVSLESQSVAQQSEREHGVQEQSSEAPCVIVYVVYFGKGQEDLAKRLGNRLRDSGMTAEVSSHEELPLQLQVAGAVPSGNSMCYHESVHSPKVDEIRDLIGGLVNNAELKVYHVGSIPLAFGYGKWQADENEILVVLNN